MKKYLFLPVLFLLISSANAFAQCTAEILQTGPLATCTGDVFTLNATPGGVAYQWSVNGVLLPGATSDNYDVPTTATNVLTYTVDIDFGTCTDVSDPVTVTVNQTPPTPTATTNSPVCTGQQLTLTANTLPGVSYQWIGPNLIMSVMQTWTIGSVVPTNAGLYTLNVIATNGCVSDSVYVMVQINPTPTVTATNTSPACEGDDVTLQVNIISGATYQWTGPNFFSSNVAFPLLSNVDQTTAGTYMVTATSTSGCTSAAASTTVTVNAPPNPPVAMTPYTYCQFDVATPLTATGVNLTWYDIQGGTSSFTAPTPSTLVPATLNYGVTQTVNGCESQQQPIVVTVNPTPLPPIVASPTTFCQFETAQLQATGVNMLWYTVQVGGTGVTAMNPNTSTLGSISYWVSQTVNGCESDRAELETETVLCDVVWPGDVNWDLTANNDDILDIGLAFGQTGTPRTGASLNWVAQPCTDWGTTQVNGADMKHADCNGDGIVNTTDEDAVNQNYGMIHPKGVHLPQAKSAALPDLYFDLTGINFVAGTTVSVPIKLGTGTLPMNNILGIAAKIKVQNVTLDSAPIISNTTSWIGNGTNTMNFFKGVSSNQTDWALVRTDHNNVSGDGTIATLVMDIPIGSSGDAILYFEGVKIINSVGDVLTDYNVVDDTASIVPVAISNIATADHKITVVPNPSEGQAELQISLAEADDMQIAITDMMGRVVWQDQQHLDKGAQKILLPASDIASGIYLVHVKSEQNGASSVIKWTKK